MKRAVIYARVSTQKQADDGVSMESQIEQCRVKAKALDAEVVQVFRDDGVSGRTDNRPGFQAALAYCAAHRVNFMVCWSSSRFGRNLEDALRNTALLRDYGTRPAYVHQDVDLETDTGWMVGVMTGMMDEIYSRNVARDTLRSMVTASRDGFFVGGHVPFGYQVEKVGKRSKLAVHEDNALIVKGMFALALNDGLGAQAIALRMNAAGMTRNGKAWGKNSVALILKSPSYMGERLFNQVHHKSRGAKPENEVVRVASHPAIVTREDFERVQAMMKQRVPHDVGGVPRSSFAFSGLLRCGICDNNLQIRNGTGRSGALYSYYACLAHKKGKPRCCLHAVRAEVFDTWMVDQLLERVLTTSVVEKIVADIRASGGKWAEERVIRRRALVKELREAESRRGNLYDVLETMGTNTPDLADVKTRLSGLVETIRNVERALEALEVKEAPNYDLVDVDPQQAVETIREVIRSCEEPKKLKAMLSTFVDHIAVSNGTVTVAYREDALLRAPNATVHSGVRWLLNLGSNQGPTD
ncbi:recombinase family protein [Variovorax sp. HJSM1_2]|uniref:recombinase family protein n=1 Tax=Variovorax sp. HJSM1_2 TaxID=3366263 RepID=UPI003BE2B6BB